VCTQNNSDYSLLQSKYLPTVGGISPGNYYISPFNMLTIVATTGSRKTGI
jgi:hypothetical protein